ncbi:MAG: hypothetical protein JNL67_06400 [Planctomycetaceae bacterium]|nr:hypothetical protein [Planctomycetaceae bacterium]
MSNDFGFGGPRRPLVWRILLFPLTILNLVLARFSSGDDLQGVRGIGGLLKLIFLSPITWSWNVGTTILLNWSSSRSVRSFVMGMPAAMFALVSTGVVVVGTLNRESVAVRYNKLFTETRSMASAEAKQEAKATKTANVAAETGSGEDPKSTTDDKAELNSSSKKYYEKAELLLNRLIRLVPSEREDNQLKKAELLLDQKKLAEAAAILQQMVRPGEAGNTKAHLLLGQYYLTEEFRKDRGFDKFSAPDQLRFTLQTNEIAMRHLEQVLISTQMDQKREAHFFLYQLYVQRRMLELAGRSLEFLTEREPGFALEHYRFFTTLLKLPQTAESMAEKNHRIFAEELQKRPDELPIWQLRIKLFLQQKRYSDAVAALIQGLESNAKMETRASLQQFLSDVYVEQGISLAENANPAATQSQRLSLFSEAIRLSPGNRRAVEQLIVLGFPLEEGGSDQWLYEAKAAAGPGSPVFYGVNMILGLRALFAGDMVQAKTYLDSAAGLGPGFSTVLQALTLAIDPNAKSMLDGTEASTTEQLPTTPALFGIYMILGSRSVVEKKFDRALEFFRKALEANPKSETAQNNVAYCLISRPNATRQDIEQALVLAGDIVKAAPHVPNFFETRGAIYLKLEEYNLAIADFERALQLKFPNPTMVHRNLVVACRGAGRIDEANAYQKMVDQAEQLNPPKTSPAENAGQSPPTTEAGNSDAPKDSNSTENGTSSEPPTTTPDQTR